MTPDIINGANVGDASNGDLPAPWVNLVNGRASISGSTGFLDDFADVYRFTPSANGIVTLALTGLSADLDLYLYDENGFVLDVAWDIDTASETIYFNVQAGNTYHVEVQPVSGGSNYFLNLDLSTLPPDPGLLGSPDWVNGVDIGDAGYNENAATEVVLGSTGDAVVYGSTGFHTDSRDWYSFVAGTWGEATFTLSGLDNDLDIYLYDSFTGNLVAYSANDGNADEAFTSYLTEGIRYLVEIDNFREGSDYRLIIDTNAQSQLLPLDRVNGVYIFEAGNRLADAARVGWNTQGYAQVSGSVGQESAANILDRTDWYYFTAPSDGFAHLSLQGGDGNPGLWVYDEAGNSLGSSLMVNAQNHLSLWVESGNSYHVRIESLDIATQYELALSMPKPRLLDFLLPPETAVASYKSFGEWANDGAFAALFADGSVATWGHSFWGGDSSHVADQLAGGVVQVFSNLNGFAALKSDGSVISWGAGVNWMPESSNPLSSGVVQLFSVADSFVALKSDGSLFAWGASAGSSEQFLEKFNSGVIGLLTTSRGFVALNADGTVESHGLGHPATLPDLAGVTRLYENTFAYAALRSDGSVVAWGDPLYGGNTSDLSYQLQSGVVDVAVGGKMFAALKDDGSVVAWGVGFNDVDGFIPFDEGLSNVARLYTNTTAFAALRNDGSVVTWGVGNHGGDSSAVADQLSAGVSRIYIGDGVFVALTVDGSVVTWGDQSKGGDSSAVADQLAGGVVDIVRGLGFAALKADGTVVSWGWPEIIGDAGDVIPQPASLSDVVKIYATDWAFAALKSDGSVVTWGRYSGGGNSSEVAHLLADGVTDLHASAYQFVALKSDGSTVTWGQDSSSFFQVPEPDLVGKNIVEFADIHTNNFHINGTEDDDTVSAFPGTNFIDAAGGNDLIWGGPQEDVIHGGEGRDALLVYGSPDEYVFFDGVLSGPEGDDSLTGIESVGFGFGFNSVEHEVMVRLAHVTDPDGEDTRISLAQRLYQEAVKQFADVEGREPSHADAILAFKALYEGKSELTTEDKVLALYIAYFDRAPDADGMAFWLAQAESGQGLYDISAGFSAHPRFAQEYGELNHQEIAEKIYLNVLRRPGDADGIDYWAGKMAEQPLSQVVVDFTIGALEIDLEALLESEDLTPEDYAIAVERQDILENLMRASKHFLALFGEATIPGGPPETVWETAAYQAAVIVLDGIDSDLTGVFDQRDALLPLIGQPDAMEQVQALLG